MPETQVPGLARLQTWCWGGLLAAAFVGLQLWPGLTEGLRFERLAFAHGAVWQPLTAQWVHLNLPHAMANAAAAVLLCWVLRGWMSLRYQGLSLLGGWLGVALVLVLDPHCTYYAGASGALHGLLAGAALHAALQPAPRRYVGIGLAAVLVTKLCWQGMGDGTESGWLGIPTYYPAHAAGAAGGALALLVLSGLRRLRPAA